MAEPAAPVPPSETPRVVPILGCDGFLLALDSMMRRGGQGSHVSQTIAELDCLPDVGRLTRAWQNFAQDHPMLLARLGRSWTTLLPAWKVPPADAKHRPPEIRLWTEANGERSLHGAEPIDSLEELCARLRHIPDGKRPPFNIRIDLLERADGTAAIVVTWSHLLVDGKGVEILLAELSRYAGDGVDEDAAAAPPAAQAVAAPKSSSIRDKMQRSRAFAQHFYEMAATKFSSMSGPKPRPSKIYCRVVTLNAEDTARVNERAAEMTNHLVNTPFFLACSAYAHARAFEARDMPAGPQIITLPIQTRPKGGRGPIFQNYVTILFFRIDADKLESVKATTKEVQKQFAQMMRNKLDTSFSMMLDLMRWIPPRVYSFFLRTQMRGEITSFFHSYTGPFSAGLESIGGARVVNGWHIPVISTPPGSGLFLGEHNGRLSLSMSWREGAITEAEQDLLMDKFIEGLLGEPAREVSTRLRY